MTTFRTDRHNNPTAFTVGLASQAGLILGVDYAVGEPFPNNLNFHTAKLLGDPIALTIEVIDKVGYQTSSGNPRWIYINLPKFVWDDLTRDEKVRVISYHYQHEGGTELKSLFA